MNIVNYFKQHTAKCRFVLLAIIVLVLLSCQSKTSNKQSLYQQLGGQAAIKSVIQRMVVRLHRDEKLAELFVDVDDKELKKNLTDFVCQISQGGCEYQGAEMVDIHAEMYVTKAEFDHFVTLFIYSMQDENIPFTAQNKLLARLAALRGQVIEL